MKLSICLGTIITAAVLGPPARSTVAADPPAAEAISGGRDVKTAAQSAGGSEEPAEGGAAEAPEGRDERFATFMTGKKLVGRYTVLGKSNGEMPEEEYTISRCEKLPEANLFRFTARIRYGDTDTELPMDLPVEWAGDTPMISLSNLWIPGLGTFSSRVLIHRDRYAGTWTHGEVGGHLFGVIRDAEDPEESDSRRNDGTPREDRSSR